MPYIDPISKFLGLMPWCLIFASFLSSAPNIPTAKSRPAWATTKIASMIAAIIIEDSWPMTKIMKIMVPNVAIQSVASRKQMMRLGSLQSAGSGGGGFVELGCMRARSRNVIITTVLEKMSVSAKLTGESQREPRGSNMALVCKP
jgi:hypothetical protein